MPTSFKWSKEHQREYAKQYHQLNKDKIKARYLKNRQHFLEYKKEYYKRNREYLMLKQRIRYRMKKWPIPEIVN